MSAKEDAVKAENLEEKIAVKDIAEIVYEAVYPQS
jgi:hypothetical protein